MTKKEVKNPRKPATKKVTNTKKENNVTDLTNLNEKELINEYKKLMQDELFTVTETQVDKLGNYIEKQEEETIKKAELNPQEIIEEFTDAAKKLDNVMISQNPEEKLKEELEKANEIAEQLEKQIKEQESKYYQKNMPWNGVSDGWYDY